MDGYSPYVVGKRAIDGSMPAGDKKILQKLEDWYQQAEAAQSRSRFEMAEDRRFKDGQQRTAEEIYELEVVRGQPALVFNEMLSTLRWVTGVERKSRVDFKIRARNREGTKDAQNKTKLMKYVMDQSKGAFHISRAFDNQSCEGLGWIEVGIRQDPTEEPIYVRYESWRNVKYDHLSVELDLSDSRFLIRDKWVDLDIAQAMFPKKKNVLKQAADRLANGAQTDEDSLAYNPMLYPDERVGYSSTLGHNDSHNNRTRIKLKEAWYRVPEKTKVLHGDGPFDGSVLKKNDEVQNWLIENGVASTFDAVKMVTYHAIFIDGALLMNEPTPHWCQTFPLFPLWGWRRGEDNAPYGLARAMKDPQRSINQQESKAAHILATKQVVMDKGAVDDIDELAEEVANPDGIIVKNQGKALEIRTDYQLAQSLVGGSARSAEFVQRVGGVNNDNLGVETNASSGKAIQLRQQQGSATTADLFDNLKYSHGLIGAYILSLIEQYYDDEKTVAILGERGEESFMTMNAEDEDGDVWSPTSFKAQYVVDSDNYSETIRQAMVDSLMAVVRDLPGEIAIKFLDLVFDISDIPMREEFVARFREINGMSDPNKEISDEEKQANQEKAQKEAQDAARAKEAEIAQLEGKAAKVQAEAEKIKLDAMLAEFTDKINAMKTALEISGAIVTAPGVAKIADDVMDDAATGITPARAN